MLDDPAQVAGPVAVAVREAARVDLVHDAAAPPVVAEGVAARGGRSARCDPQVARLPADAFAQPVGPFGELGLAGACAVDDRGRGLRGERRVGQAEPDGVQSSLGLGQLAFEAGVVSPVGLGIVGRGRRSDDRLELARDDEQVGRAVRAPGAGPRRSGDGAAAWRARAARSPARAPRRPDRARPGSRRRPAATSPARARLGAGVADRPDELDERLERRVSAAGRARPRPGQRATISSGGSSTRDAAATPQSASVTNGMTGCSSRRYVSSASTRVHQVASRSAAGSDVVGEADLRELEAPVAELAPDRVVQHPGDLGERVVGHRGVHRLDGARRRATRSSARPGRGRAASGSSPLDVRPGSTPAGRRARTASRSTACSRSCGRSRASPARTAGRCPGAAPWIRANRSASAPDSSMTPERIDDVALRLRHLLAVRVADEPGQVDRVERLRVGQVRPSIIIRATQKKMMS